MYNEIDKIKVEMKQAYNRYEELDDELHEIAKEIIEPFFKAKDYDGAEKKLREIYDSADVRELSLGHDLILARIFRERRG